MWLTAKEFHWGGENEQLGDKCSPLPAVFESDLRCPEGMVEMARNPNMIYSARLLSQALSSCEKQHNQQIL